VAFLELGLTSGAHARVALPWIGGSRARSSAS